MRAVKKQQGAVLLIAMVMLTVLSIIVISASSTTAIQQKMTANLRDKEIARERAEFILQLAEASLLKLSQKNLNKKFDQVAGYYFFDNNRILNKPNAWSKLQVVETNAVPKTSTIIEQMPAIRTAGNSLDISQLTDSHFYRITVLAQGGTKSSTSILQSFVKK